MTRCEHRDRELVGEPPHMREKQHRCPDPAVWVWRGHWYCDDHTRKRWEFDLAERLWCPRSTESGDDPDLTVPAWVPETMHARADRFANRVQAPAAPSLFGETT